MSSLVPTVMHSECILHEKPQNLLLHLLMIRDDVAYAA